jgi:hypothetical protein
MKAQQIVLPFLSNNTREARKRTNLDLVGRTYRDDYVSVTVIGVCDNDERRVLVRRQPGSTVSMLGWLVRSIFTEEDKNRKCAA